MKNEAMKSALKNMSKKHLPAEGSLAEEAAESPEKEAEEMGLAPSTAKGKVAPDDKGLMGNPLVAGKKSPPVSGPVESGDANVNGMKKFDSYISPSSDSKSLGNKVKENIKKAIMAKGKK